MRRRRHLIAIPGTQRRANATGLMRERENPCSAEIWCGYSRRLPSREGEQKEKLERIGSNMRHQEESISRCCGGTPFSISLSNGLASNEVQLQSQKHTNFTTAEMRDFDSEKHDAHVRGCVYEVLGGGSVAGLRHGVCLQEKSFSVHVERPCSHESTDRGSIHHGK